MSGDRRPGENLLLSSQTRQEHDWNIYRWVAKFNNPMTRPLIKLWMTLEISGKRKNEWLKDRVFFPLWRLAIRSDTSGKRRNSPNSIHVFDSSLPRWSKVSSRSVCRRSLDDPLSIRGIRKYFPWNCLSSVWFIGEYLRQISLRSRHVVDVWRLSREERTSSIEDRSIDLLSLDQTRDEDATVSLSHQTKLSERSIPSPSLSQSPLSSIEYLKKHFHFRSSLIRWNISWRNVRVCRLFFQPVFRSFDSNIACPMFNVMCRWVNSSEINDRWKDRCRPFLHR